MRSIVITAALIVAACTVSARNRGSATEGPAEGEEPVVAPSPQPAQRQPSTCAATRNVVECGACCEQTNPEAAAHYYRVLDTCFCRTPGVCKTACASTVCGPSKSQPDQECITCLEQNESCYDSTDQTCSQSGDCMRLLQCDQESECGAKSVE